ncbi:response regulator transcription factor [Lactonifactor longoviformis]|uniref:Stage 0 sporulation protein A homolog n=1 Tax=Lactonifactor longoviformis DSM 17459 TaxID=1122155 RepID=A0A1M5BNA5_9CLOT|nr:response regulator transcription factor [Lactonifactor longoviformis]SHF44008.1 two component transcriptional regulator, LuxR family [Lactonifactor longoviformis DSM 17459]
MVDDHALFAKSLSIVLEDFPEIHSFSCAAADDGLIRRVKAEQPDILLMDINLGKMNEEDGLLIAGHILDEVPQQKIVMLSGYDLPVYRREARRLGAKGFVNKNVEPEELVAVLKKVQSGRVYFPADTWMAEDLTETEKKVLSLVAAGTKRREIARQLYSSERTVSNHLQHIFEKLEVSSAVEAVTKAIQMGYIVPDFTEYER